MNLEIYPLKFQPILKDKIWGGQKLKNLLGKPSQTDTTGESWEISAVEGNESVIANGSYMGVTLKDLISSFKAQILGEKNYKIFGEKFPLLIKYIDAKKDLSVQLHPNDELAAKRHNSFGKTEMWHVMQANPGSNLIVGFNQPVNSDLYLKNLENKSLLEILNFEPITKGDTFFIEVGRVHAIGAGVMLAEIQQTSDITYRVYDWDRVDAAGNSRELHNDLAIDAIDFDMPENFKVVYSKENNESNVMVECPYFTTNFIPLESEIRKENKFNSFIIYMCVEGEAEVVINNHSERMKMGETILIPAACEHYSLIGNNANLLEVYV